MIRVRVPGGVLPTGPGARARPDRRPSRRGLGAPHHAPERRAALGDRSTRARRVGRGRAHRSVDPLGLRAHDAQRDVLGGRRCGARRALRLPPRRPRAVSDAILARSATLNCELPSRVNIAFGGSPRCREDALINDAAFVSTWRDGELGYELWAGGSLGKSPSLSILLVRVSAPCRRARRGRGPDRRVRGARVLRHSGQGADEVRRASDGRGGVPRCVVRGLRGCAAATAPVAGASAPLGRARPRRGAAPPAGRRLVERRATSANGRAWRRSRSRSHWGTPTAPSSSCSLTWPTATATATSCSVATRTSCCATCPSRRSMSCVSPSRQRGLSFVGEGPRGSRARLHRLSGVRAGHLGCSRHRTRPARDRRGCDATRRSESTCRAAPTAVRSTRPVTSAWPAPRSASVATTRRLSPLPRCRPADGAGRRGRRQGRRGRRAGCPRCRHRDMGGAAPRRRDARRHGRSHRRSTASPPRSKR